MNSKTLNKLIQKENLSTQEAEDLMSAIMKGELGEILTGAYLTALASKGESPSEIASFAKVMRNVASPWPKEIHPPILCDTCGTGGDQASTINISTLGAIILASLGIPIAKHGNRAVSSTSGSSDVLQSLGIPLDKEKEVVVSSLEKNNITFLFAPNWHPAMKYVGTVRKTLGIRTVFNLLGPITNPAPISHQILGVFDLAYQEILAEALVKLGRSAYVICSEDGLDEFSCFSQNFFIKIEDGKIQEKGKLSLEKDFGVHLSDTAKKADLEVKSLDEASQRALAILEGKGTEVENITIALNSALLYELIKKVSKKEAFSICYEAIVSAKGLGLLEKWKKFLTNA